MRKTAILIAILIAPLVSPQGAYACSCMYYEDEEERQEAYISNADLVIQGVPIEVDFKKDGQKHYSVSVEKVWKGKADAIVDVATALDGAGCGIDLELDTPVVIFAYQSKGQYQTGLCSGTAQANESLVTWLNNFDGSSTPPLSEEPPAVDCTPYSCKNGDRFPRCDGDNVINYLMQPCELSGGEGPEEKPKGFADVPEGHSNYQSISFVRNEGIVSGYEGNLYKPNQRINRAEFTKIIVAANFTGTAIESCDASNLFSDVRISDWFAKYICAAKKDGIIDGYPDNTFKPEDFVNFAEAAKIVVGAFGITIDAQNMEWLASRSSAEQSEGWWRPYVFALSKIGGLPSTFSDPNQQLTRGDMAEIIYRVKMGMDY